jgi:hypothetical protein
MDTTEVKEMPLVDYDPGMSDCSQSLLSFFFSPFY